MNRRAFLGATLVSTLAAQQRRTRNLILITADGLRWQELFGGIDAGLMNEKEAGMGDAKALREQLWKATPEERRLALMPYFWGKLVPRGVLLGNVAKGSIVEVTNRYKVSYPGYSEILTGRAQDDVIRGNDPVRNPTPSFLQFVKQEWKLLPEKVAVFASWDRFREICDSKPGEIYINAGYEPSTLPKGSPRVDLINQLQSDVRFVNGARFDGFTFRLAMDYLKALQPRILYIALDETDDYAHDRRYGRVLESIRWFDRALQELWTWIETTPAYRGTTSVIITSDHGRGPGLADWHSHGAKIEGAKNIWIFGMGPDTPATGEVSGGVTHYQRDIAPTALAMLGIDPGTYPGVVGKPIAALVRN